MSNRLSLIVVLLFIALVDVKAQNDWLQWGGPNRDFTSPAKGLAATWPAEELWFHRRLRIHHGNAIRIGDYVYGSSGDFGPAFFAAVHVKTGDVLYQDRSFPKTTFLLADGKFIMLDEDGNLALATASPDG